MNFSKVRVQGLLKSNARTLNDGSALYLISDGTGSLPVFLNFTPSNTLPKAGCNLVASGYLNIGKGNQIRMHVHHADQIIIQKNPTPITVYGEIAEIRMPLPNSKAPYKIILSTIHGSIEIIHWFSPKQKWIIGEPLKAKGIFGFYNGQRQLKIRNSSDLQNADVQSVKWGQNKQRAKSFFPLPKYFQRDVADGRE